MTTSPPRPVFIYDGDCAFCARSVAWTYARAHPTAPARAYQFIDLAGYGLTAERADRESLWVSPDGRVAGGARAFAALLRTGPGRWRLAALALDLPPVRPVAAAVYRLVARNRHRLPGGTAACQLPPSTSDR